jgi:hypothetical protein
MSMPVGTVAIQVAVGGNLTLFTNIGEFTGVLAESAGCYSSALVILASRASGITP